MNNGKETSLQEDVNIVDVLVVIDADQQTTLNSLNLNLEVNIDSKNDELSSNTAEEAPAEPTKSAETEVRKKDDNDDDHDDNKVNDSTNTSSSTTNNYNNNDSDHVDDKKLNELHNIVDEHHVISLVSSNIIIDTATASTAAATITPASLSIQNDERKKDNFQTIMANSSKRIRQVHERANSLGKMYQSSSSRRVSFAENDCDLVTGYLEPANPWASVKPVASISELAELYKESCEKHKSKPIDIIIKHLETLDLSTKTRRPKLDLRAQALTAESCEPLEELLKRIQYKQIDLTGCGLDDVSATALFDMIEYYEATNEIDISENSKIANRGWQSCCNMIKRSHALQMLATRCTLLSESNATNLGKAMLGSSLHTLKLEHCGLTGRPIASLCIYLRRNTVLKELSLAHNDLTSSDAYNIGIVLKSNFYLQFLDVSNNRIEDLGVLLITEALMEQSKHFRQQQELTATNITAATNTSSSAVSSSTIDKTNDSINSVDTTMPTETITLCDDKLSSIHLNKPPTLGNGNGNNSGRSMLETLLQNQKQTELQQQQQQQQLQQIIIADDIDTVEKNDNQIIELSTTPPPLSNNNNNNNNLLVVNPLSLRPATPGPTKKLPPPTPTEIELKIIEDIDVDRKTTTPTTTTSDQDLINFDGILDIPTVFLPTSNSCELTTTSTSSIHNNNSLTETDVFFHNHQILSKDKSNDDDVDVAATAINVIEEQLIDVSIDTDTNDVKIFDINENNSITNLDSSLEISQSDLIVYNDNNVNDNDDGTTAIITETPPESPSTKTMMSNSTVINDDKKLPIAESCNNEKKNIIFDNDADQKNVKHKVQIENSQCNENEMKMIMLMTTTTTATTTTITTTSTPITTSTTLSNIVIEKPTELLPHIPLSSSFTSVSSVSSSPNTLLHCTPQTLRKSADNILLTPDSSQSLDSSLCELSVSFEQSTPISVKVFQSAAAASSSSCAPERSFSSESLNSETSIDSNDSKSSIRLTEAKFSRNGTLERHQSNNSIAMMQPQQIDTITGSSGTVQAPAAPAPSGLQVLIMWNNRITRQAAQSVSDLLAVTKTLEILNIGRNVLSNDFLINIKSNLKANTSLTNLGLQGAHLTCTGIQTLADVLEFGGNSTLQRIDLRDNNLQVNGLMAMNDVLKSNKSVTRIDLDDVPRRGDSSSDSSIDYSRMVNNIRAQCARNENPPEPEAIRTTSIRRLRNTYLNSRKISLTCHTFRTNESSSTSSTTKVTERNLLDPNRKSAGRLRSPLPSPIPSPVSSPVPSPSRSSRFQVSRVVETSTSPITPPPSINCSPTSFPVSQSTSRFRVTTVVEPAVASSLLKPLSVTKMTKPKSVPANMNNSMTNTCINTIVSSTTTPTILATPATIATTNTPISTKEESQSIKISSTPTNNITTVTSSSSSSNNTTITHITPPSIEKRTQIIDIPTTITSIVQLSPPTLTPPPSSSTCKSSLSDQQLATAVSHSISTSFDSPDLEVKRYMDDSCSSISSIESIERHHDFNTSNSSIDSVESLISETIKSPFSSLDGNTSGGGGGLTMLSGCASSIGQLPLSIIDICSSKIHDSLSSLETSTCSNESFDDSQDILTATASAIESSTSSAISTMPIISSNEGTLTNSPNNICYCKSSSGRHQQQQQKLDLNIVTDDKDNHSSSGSGNSGGGTVKHEKRVRKTSWMMNPMSSTKSESGYPATLDKLLSLFQHPGNFFTRSSSSDTTATTTTTTGKKESSTSGGGGGGGGSGNNQSTGNNHENKPPSRKDSPMGGLFAWTTSSNRKDDTEISEQSASTPHVKVIKSPLKTNISPENTVITTSSIIGGTPAATPIDLISGKLKQEMKENISPEHTITATTIMNVKSQQANVSSMMQYPLMETTHEKVVFELGGGDEDDEPFQQPIASSTITTTTTTATTIDVSNNSANNNNNNGNIRMLGSSSHTGIGQIARDSLSILKGSSTNSQDSMRSLESLSETQSNIE